MAWSPPYLHFELPELDDSLLSEPLYHVVRIILDQLLHCDSRVPIAAIFDGIPHTVGVSDQQRLFFNRCFVPHGNSLVKSLWSRQKRLLHKEERAL